MVLKILQKFRLYSHVDAGEENKPLFQCTSFQSQLVIIKLILTFYQSRTVIKKNCEWKLLVDHEKN